MEKKTTRVKKTGFDVNTLPALLDEVQASIAPRPEMDGSFLWRRVTPSKHVLWVPLGGGMYWSITAGAGPAGSLVLLSCGVVCPYIRDSDEQPVPGPTSRRVRPATHRRGSTGAVVHDVTSSNVLAAISTVFGKQSVYEFMCAKGYSYQNRTADRQVREKVASLIDALLGTDAGQVIRDGSGEYEYKLDGASVHISNGRAGLIDLKLKNLDPMKALNLVGVIQGGIEDENR